MTAKPSYNELEKKLCEAEEILEALRNHKVDAVIGIDEIALLRLKQVEDQLQEQIQISDNRLKEIESIYHNIPVGLCILDRNLKFIRINNHLAVMNGIPAEEHLGCSICDLLPKMAGDLEADLLQVIETGEARTNLEVRGETPAQPGVERYWLQHWLPLYNKQGKVIGISMVIEEITRRKQFEKKLRQLNATLEERVAERTRVAEERANKLREMALKMTQVEERERQRLARMLHDGLQQLLISAKYNTSLIKKRLPDQNNVEEQFAELNQILDQSIESSRSLSYELSPPILHDQGLLAALHWLAEMRHMKALTISIHAENEVPELSQNLKVFLFQAARELLVNIIKHADVDEAEIRLSCDDSNLNLEVIDYGKGFDVGRINFHDSVSQGLRNIREKLDLMDGSLKIDSEPGRGSRFVLQVPIHAREGRSKQEENEEHFNMDYGKTGNVAGPAFDDSGAIRVLVVDDHHIMRNGLVKMLAEEADIHIAGEASNGVEAVDFVHSVQPDVVVMDITMPEMDGIEATQLIHEEFPGIHIVGLSMHEESEYTLLMKKAGASVLLNKGGPADELFEAIRSVKK